MSKITLSGTGCTLLDFVYSDIDFNGEAFRSVSSVEPGDGGVDPGKLVFLKDLERYSGKSFESLVRLIAGDRKPDASNLGGPAIVSLIHCMQLLEKESESLFIAAIGTDWIGEKIKEIVGQTPLKNSILLEKDDRSAFTNVFSDPRYAGGHGERCFINNIGAAGLLLPEDLPSEFFNSDIMALGGTALVPQIHDRLDDILDRAGGDCYKIVNTVYDFRNEQRFPGKPWPLGKGNCTLEKIDLLIMDSEEALKISGTKNLEAATGYFIHSPVRSFIITNGTEPVTAHDRDSGLIRLPASQSLIEKSRTLKDADTTGAGDNFAGGVIYSVAAQRMRGNSAPDLYEALKWGVVSGGFACTYIGGTFIESSPGEKMKQISHYFNAYEHQLSTSPNWSADSS